MFIFFELVKFFFLIIFFIEKVRGQKDIKYLFIKIISVVSCIDIINILWLEYQLSELQNVVQLVKQCILMLQYVTLCYVNGMMLKLFEKWNVYINIEKD